MESSLISYTVHVLFDSVLAMDHEGIVAMFEALVASGLKEFLGCLAVLYEAALIEFFQNGSVRDGMVVPKDLVFDARSIFSFTGEQLKTQMQSHGLQWELPSCSRLFEGKNRDRGAVFARSNTNFKSSCWIHSMICVNESWAIEPCADYWKNIPKHIVPSTIVISPRLSYVDTLPTVRLFFKLLKKRWADVCTDVHMVLSESRSSSSGSAHPDPTVFAIISQRPLDTDWTSPHPSSMDSRVFFTTDDTPMGVNQVLMPTVVTPQDFTEPLAQLRALVSQISIERLQMRNDSDKLQDMLLMEIRSLEKKVTEMLIQQDSLYRGLFNNMRQEIQIQKSALSLDILDSQRKLITQQAAIATGLEDIRKDVDETKAALSNAILDFHAQAQENYNNLSSQLGELVAYMNRGLEDIRKDVDETKAALSNAILDFHAQAQENYNNLSSQGELVAYMNRGNDKNGEESSSRRPQPPPDDQNRPSGGSAIRGGGSGGSSRRDDKRGSSTKRGSSSSGGGGSGTASEPYKKNAEWWLYGKNQF
ncbi:hypothetical protein F511_31538 [Dorcoceras hygrometricum]|uniref:Uncharacterized protein n=1 Tax=Dorcoceras hygrometricum TaxID=472368 RepID=A0A2Z7CNB9_9LAMI|nr:hypothetical protein F511_31538 [Dorcoceras hygrometricum]